MKLLLYTADHCPLCQDAAELVYQTLENAGAGNVALETINISNSLALKKRYGLKIPVLAIAVGKQVAIGKQEATGELATTKDEAAPELYWPFDPHQLIDFIQPYLNQPAAQSKSTC